MKQHQLDVEKAKFAAKKAKEAAEKLAQSQDKDPEPKAELEHPEK